MHVYISLKANIFEYGEFGDGSHVDDPHHRSKSYRVDTLDKEQKLSHGLLHTWTMVYGHLTKIEQALEGFRVMTISFDPAKTNCTFQVKDEPDSKTGKFWVYRTFDGTPSEIYGRTVDSYSCTIKKGNVFGPDQ